MESAKRLRVVRVRPRAETERGMWVAVAWRARERRRKSLATCHQPTRESRVPLMGRQRPSCRLTDGGTGAWREQTRRGLWAVHGRSIGRLRVAADEPTAIARRGKPVGLLPGMGGGRNRIGAALLHALK